MISLEKIVLSVDGHILQVLKKWYFVPDHGYKVDIER